MVTQSVSHLSVLSAGCLPSSPVWATLLPVTVILRDLVCGDCLAGPDDFSNIAAETPEMVDLTRPGSIWLSVHGQLFKCWWNTRCVWSAEVMPPGAVDNQRWISVTLQRSLFSEYFPANKSETDQNSCTLNICKCRNSTLPNRETGHPSTEKRNWTFIPYHIQNSHQVD